MSTLLELGMDTEVGSVRLPGIPSSEFKLELAEVDMAQETAEVVFDLGYQSACCKKMKEGWNFLVFFLEEQSVLTGSQRRIVVVVWKTNLEAMNPF